MNGRTDRADRRRGVLPVRRRADRPDRPAGARRASSSAWAATSRTLNPGLAILVPFMDRLKPLIDLREQVVSFAPQPVITEDNLVVQIDTVLYFTITDAKAASPTRSPTRCRRSSSSPSPRCATSSAG